MSNITTSPGPGKLNLADFLKGSILAIGTPVLYFLQEIIPHWNLDPIVKVALSAYVTYLLKNLFTSAQITINNPQVGAIDAVKEGTATVKVISK